MAGEGAFDAKSYDQKMGELCAPCAPPAAPGTGVVPWRGAGPC
jgi:hypothetical protein